MLTSVTTIIQSLNHHIMVSIAYPRGRCQALKYASRVETLEPSQDSKYVSRGKQPDFENTYSVPVPLILEREYILIETTMMAMNASVQTIAINDPPLSRSPPLGTGSVAMGVLEVLRNEVEIKSDERICARRESILSQPYRWLLSVDGRSMRRVQSF